jgi:signal transduction histidine kinase
VNAGRGPRTIPSEARCQKEKSFSKTETRSPLAQLLHALNQPVTGLQCSMEVALASPRTPEQYVHGLQEGLELMERMRALVEAIREVADGREEKNQESESTDLKTLLREVLDDLEPVAEGKSVCITLECSADFSGVVKAGRRKLATAVFRLLESALSLAARGSALRIEMGGAAKAAEDDRWISLRWHASGPAGGLSRPELGLLVAQAGWERAGAVWERERTENMETVTIRLARFSAGSRNS